MICLVVLVTFGNVWPTIGTYSSRTREEIQILNEVRRDNRAAIDAIKTLVCRFQTEELAPSQLGSNTFVEFPLEGVYRRKGTSYRTSSRIQTSPSAILTDQYFRQGQIFSLATNRALPSTSDPIETYEAKSGSDTVENLWHRLLATHFSSDQFLTRATFDEILSLPHQILQISRFVAGERNSDYVQLKNRSGVFEFWFDKKMNGWIWKSTLIPSTADHVKHEWEVLEVFRSKDGTVFPSMIGRKIYDHEKLIGHVRTVLTDIQVNEPLTEVELAIPNMAGRYCCDRERNVQFPVDAIGNRLGPEIPIPPVQYVPVERLLYPREHTSPLSGSKDTLGTVDIVILIGVPIGIIVGILWFVKRGLFRNT